VKPLVFSVLPGAASLRGLQDILIKFIFLKLITVDIDIEAKKPAYAGRLF